MKELQARAASGFAKAFGAQPDLLATAPGRVNLIGEHTDYNDGWVLPMAIGHGTAVAARRRSDNRLRVVALDLGAECTFDLAAQIAPAAHGDWSNYVRGVAAALAGQGVALAGAELAIAGNVPQGAGLSSSASLEVAVGLALTELCGSTGHDRTALALAGQRAEHDYAGCNCGIMDQLVSARAEAGSALLIDCRSLDAQPVPFPAGLGVLIVHSGIRRGLVEGEYNTRRAQCEEAARVLGVAALRDVGPEQLEGAAHLLSDVVYRRALHVVSENARTLAAAKAISAGDLEALGALMAQSHGSMRDLFEITTPRIDQLAELLRDLVGQSGGARMTGGGFGGAVIAAAPVELLRQVDRQIRELYTAPDGNAPVTMIELPMQGASAAQID